MNNEFRLLGIIPTTDLTAVRSAYKAKALQYHPDRSGGDAEKFKLVHKAYNALVLHLESGRGLEVTPASHMSNHDRKGCGASNEESFAATWSGLGTSNAGSSSGGARSRSSGVGVGKFTGTFAARTFGMPASQNPTSFSSSSPSSFSNRASDQRRASTPTWSYKSKGQGSTSSNGSHLFMNPTKSSKGAENPKVTRYPASTAPIKPSTLKESNNKSDKTGSATSINRESPSAAAAFIKRVLLPVEFQKADLTRIILDVSPNAFALIAGSHLKFKSLVSRRTDGMQGQIAGVCPATGTLYWHKDGSTYVMTAGGSAADYVPIPTTASLSSSFAHFGNGGAKNNGPQTPIFTTTNGEKENSCGISPSNSSPCSTEEGRERTRTPRNGASIPIPSSSPPNSASTKPTPSPSSPAKSGAGEGCPTSKASSGKFVDPFAVTDDTNTIYFSSPLGRRTNTVSGVFGVLGGGTAGVASVRVDTTVCASRKPHPQQGEVGLGRSNSDRVVGCGIGNFNGEAFRPFPAQPFRSPPPPPQASSTPSTPTATTTPTHSLFTPVASFQAVTAQYETDCTSSRPTTPTPKHATLGVKSSLPLHFPVTAVPTLNSLRPSQK